MINHFTPEESQDFLKNKKITTKLFQTEPKPSALTMNFVFGYSAALTILKTINFGNVKVLLN
jgi:hypothetical protein